MSALLDAPAVSASPTLWPASVRPQRQPPYTSSTVRRPQHRTAQHGARSPALHPLRGSAGGVSLRLLLHPGERPDPGGCRARSGSSTAARARQRVSLPLIAEAFATTPAVITSV